MMIINSVMPFPEISLNVGFKVLYVPNKFDLAVNSDNQRKDSCP